MINVNRPIFPAAVLILVAVVFVGLGLVKFIPRPAPAQAWCSELNIKLDRMLRMQGYDVPEMPGCDGWL